ncbi:hypothetical protein AB0F77_08345 [Streptomyces sp. NPDC026672]|uniref:hypothetical protein n=1 Tax=unclassified Streptomyces TaxID=2593676 RepID=UPI0033DB5DA2
MSWTRGIRAALLVCALLLVAPAGCGTGEAHERHGGEPPSPAGRLLDETDGGGRRYREAAGTAVPHVSVEVTPDTAGGWDVRLTLRHFRLSPAPAPARAAAGRGVAYLFVDGGLVTRLRSPAYHLAARLVPKGTHHVTARLYADDATVWAVHGEPVESTADVTASETESLPSGAGGRGSPDPAGKAS